MKITYSLSSSWIRSDMTLRIILSLSINTVLCIIAITSSNISLFSKTFFNSNLNASIPPPKTPTATGATYTVTWTSFSRLECDLSILRLSSQPFFAPILFRCGHAMSQIQIFLSILSSKIKSSLLAEVVLSKWNSKSHISFAYCSPTPFLYPIFVDTR